MSLPRKLHGSSLPLRLLDLPEPPPALFVHGELSSAPLVAIVGTRSPTVEARAYAGQLAQSLAAQGVTIASGGALGIDTSAHEGALAVGGKTIVVAPSSLDRPYPSENAALFARVLASGGAFVSAFELDVPARNPQFFVRNSYLAALCHALVMVEAPLRSGARNAGLWARKLRRPFFVVPATPWNKRGLGCIVELKLGARPLYSYRDLLECLKQQNLHCIPATNSPAPDADRRPIPILTNPVLDSLEPESRKVLHAVAQGAHHPDAICALSGLSVPEVQAQLLTLTLLKVLVAEPAGTYRLPRSNS